MRNWSSKLQENNQRKNAPVAQMSVFFMPEEGVRPEVFLRLKLPLSQRLCYFRESNFSQCFLYYQQLYVARYQVSFYANKQFE